MTANKPPLARFLAAAATGGAIGAVANLVLYFVATGALGVAMSGELDGPGTGAKTLPPVVVAIASLVPSLLGGVLAWGLAKATDKGPRIFLIIGVLFLLISVVGPIRLTLASTGTIAVLELMHFVVGIPVLWLLHRVTRS